MAEERNPRGRDELTADPVFLLQRREVRVIRPGCKWAWDTELEAFAANREAVAAGVGPTAEEYPEADWPSAEDREFGAVPTIGELDLFNALGSECGTETWHTERVFLTREEGERYGNSRAYNYRHGWRVYCVPCLGDLAKLLREYDAGKLGAVGP